MTAAPARNCPPLGAHMSIAGGFYKAVEAAAALGMDCLQIFTGSPQIWAVKQVTAKAAQSKSTGSRKSAASTIAAEPVFQAAELKAEEIARFRDTFQASGLAHPIAHDSYLINLASPDELLWRKSVAAFVVEMQRAEQLGIPFVVTHPGSHVSLSEEAGLQRVVQGLDEVHSQTRGLKVQCLLETTAGQGTCLGWKFEHLAAILDGIREPDRVGVCMDTCHIFAAGYPLASEADYRATMRKLDQTVGLEKVKAMHLNDSKKGLGSRVDRHEKIGAGQLGLEPFRHLLNDRRFRRVPMYLETPKGKEDGVELDLINLDTLRSLVA